MDYYSKLVLAKDLEKIKVPRNTEYCRKVYELMKPLCTKKKVNFLLYTEVFPDKLRTPMPEYYSMARKYCRRGQVQEFSKLAGISKFLSYEDNSPQIDYPEELQSFLPHLDGKEFEMGGKVYSFYIPKTNNDFYKAYLYLNNCIISYADRHLVETFKFFIKQDETFYCSVELDRETLILNCNGNQKPSQIVNKQVSEALNRFLPLIKNFNEKLKGNKKPPVNYDRLRARL